MAGLSSLIEWHDRLLRNALMDHDQYMDRIKSIGFDTGGGGFSTILLEPEKTNHGHFSVEPLEESARGGGQLSERKKGR